MKSKFCKAVAFVVGGVTVVAAGVVLAAKYIEKKREVHFFDNISEEMVEDILPNETECHCEECECTKDDEHTDCDCGCHESKNTTCECECHEKETVTE